ncbi:MAG TPA: hypothetical protein VN036_13640, partial [Devosia sp.]|nr:hypothetical protein [Devosia sp.]
HEAGGASAQDDDVKIGHFGPLAALCLPVSFRQVRRHSKFIDSFLFESMRSPAFLLRAYIFMRSFGHIAAFMPTRLTAGGVAAMTKTTKTA